MAVTDTLRRWFGFEERVSGNYPLAFQDWANMFSFGGNAYSIRQTLVSGGEETIDANFEGVVQGAFRDNGIIFACMVARQLLFSEARFQFRQLRRGRPGDLFGNADLDILEHPWPNATTGDLLSRVIQHADIAGNAYIARRQRRLKVLRPDWVTIVRGTDDDPEATGDDIDADLIGYLFHPGGRYSGRDPVALLPDEVAHFAPIPDPAATYRGMSWITPVIREILGDKAASNHKLRFFENGATPNMVISLDPTISTAAFKEWINLFEERHSGAVNAYKTAYLGGGAKVERVGTDLKQLDFKVVQGAGETRIAAAAGVPPIIVGLSEGLESATYSNYGQARRRFADGTMRPLWRNVAGSLSSIIPVPSASELWYDDRDIPFLAEDVKDAAAIIKEQMLAIESGVRSGYTPESVVSAITAGDLNRLTHTGLYSVQLQPPMPDGPVQPTPVTPPEIEAGRAMLQLVQAAIEQRAQPLLSDGAIRIDSPITVEAPQIHFPEGFVRSETPVTVESPVTIEKGAVQVDSPVTVESPTVTIEEGAIRSETPVTVTAPERGKRSVRIERNGDNVRLVEDDDPA